MSTRKYSLLYFASKGQVLFKQNRIKNISKLKNALTLTPRGYNSIHFKFIVWVSEFRKQQPSFLALAKWCFFPYQTCKGHQDSQILWHISISIYSIQWYILSSLELVSTNNKIHSVTKQMGIIHLYIGNLGTDIMSNITHTYQAAQLI